MVVKGISVRVQIIQGAKGTDMVIVPYPLSEILVHNFVVFLVSMKIIERIQWVQWAHSTLSVSLGERVEDKKTDIDLITSLYAPSYRKNSPISACRL